MTADQLQIREPLGLTVPHRSRVAVIGCIDDRLVQADADFTKDEGGGFLVRMAAGAASMILSRDAESAMGQFTDAYGVNPFSKILLRIHAGCGKIISLVGEGQELAGIDPYNPVDLYMLAELAAARLTGRIHKLFGVLLHFEIIVHEVVPGPGGRPASRELTRLTLPRGGHMNSFTNFADRHPDLMDLISRH